MPQPFVVQYDFKKDAAAPTPRECASVGVIDDAIYLFGGNDLQHRFSDMLRLDTKTMEWSVLPSNGPRPAERSAQVSAPPSPPPRLSEAAPPPRGKEVPLRQW